MITIDAVGKDGRNILHDLDGASPTGGLVTSEHRARTRLTPGDVISDCGAWVVVVDVEHQGIPGVTTVGLMDAAGATGGHTLIGCAGATVRTDTRIDPDTLYKLARINEVDARAARLDQLEPSVLHGTATPAEVTEYRTLSAAHQAWIKSTPEYAAQTADLIARGILPPHTADPRAHASETTTPCVQQTPEEPTSADRAVACVEGAGLTVLDRGWSCSEGTIPVVAREGRVLVVVEINEGTGGPVALSRGQRSRWRRLAIRWLVAHGQLYDEVRIDLVHIRHEGAARVAELVRGVG
jgi:Holliday junction resolvase-like predicted endonuclease